MTGVDVLSVSGADPEATAVVGGGEALTYRELNARVDRRAESMSGELDDAFVVPVTVRPDVSSVIELLALWRSDRIPAPLNHRLTAAERALAEDELQAAAVPDGTHVVLWTSGTAGRPRGVALSWANLQSSAWAAEERLELSSDDVWVVSLSPAHVGGLALMTRSVLLGGTLVAPTSLDAAALSRLLDEGAGASGSGGAARGSAAKPTHLSLVPTQLLRLLEHRGQRRAPEQLRCVLVGGAHAPAALVRRALEQGWPLALTYGATEMSSQIATASPQLTREVPGTVGSPLPGVEVRVDADGELLTRGPTRALGYVGRSAGALADTAGWYATGDLGRIDGDGRLWITGRRMDRIVSGGVTVDAVEVEEALRAHPTVIDACVVGVPDEEWGERVGAWVEPVVGEMELEELERHLRERLAPAKLPRLWRIDGEIPRNANGKADRGAVREALTR